MLSAASSQQNRLKYIGNYVYETGKCLGVGSSGEVFLGFIAQTKEPVAIKAINFSKIANEFDAELLNNEIVCQKKLSHPNIVKVYDQLFSSQRLYIVTEYCEGGNLFDWIHTNGCMNEQMALRVLYQIVQAVKYIHDKGIVHRDIKSANILLKKDFTVKLADFGFASFMHNHYYEQYKVGSPLYMSPEAHAYRQYTNKSDNWAMGMILYEMFMGRQPFAYSDMNDVLRVIQDKSILLTLPAHVSQLSIHILNRLWTIDPQTRADTNQILLLLENYFGAENQNMKIQGMNVYHQDMYLRQAPLQYRDKPSMKIIASMIGYM